MFSRPAVRLLSIAFAVVLGIGLLFYLLHPFDAVSRLPVDGMKNALPPSSTVRLIPDDAAMKGPFAARNTIVEFVDYQCPGCAAYQPVMKELRETLGDKIRIVVRHFPLSEIHPFAKGAAIAAVCAQRQGKFFEYSDVLFANQKYLRRADLERYAEEFGLDMNAFRSCLEDPTVEERVIRDRLEGEVLGVQTTPMIFWNGRMIDDFPTVEEWSRRIR